MIIVASFERHGLMTKAYVSEIDHGSAESNFEKIDNFLRRCRFELLNRCHYLAENIQYGLVPPFQNVMYWRQPSLKFLVMDRTDDRIRCCNELANDFLAVGTGFHFGK